MRIFYLFVISSIVAISALADTPLDNPRKSATPSAKAKFEIPETVDANVSGGLTTEKYQVTIRKKGRAERWIRNLLKEKQNVDAVEIQIEKGFLENPQNQTITYDFGGGETELVVVNVEKDSFGMTHILAADPNHKGKWVMMSVDQDRNTSFSAFESDRVLRVSQIDGQSHVMVQGKRKIRRNEQNQSKRHTMRERRHVQMTEKISRGIQRDRQLSETGETSYVLGGNLGTLRSENDLQRYVQEMDNLLGSSAEAEIVSDVVEDANGRKKYFAYQYIDGARGDTRIQITTDEATGNVLSMRGAVSGHKRFQNLKVDSESVASDLAMREALNQYPSDDPNDPITVTSVEKRWQYGKGNQPLMYWLLELRNKSNTRSLVARVDAKTGKTRVSVPLFGSSMRIGTCEGNNSQGARDCTGFSGDFPWVVYDDNDRDRQCNTTPAECNLPKYNDPQAALQGLEVFWESVLGNRCCDLSGSTLNIVVNSGAVSDMMGTLPNAAYDITSDAILLSNDTIGLSVDILAHEAGHGLLDHRNAEVTQDAIFNNDQFARAIHEGYADTNAALYRAESVASTAGQVWIIGDDHPASPASRDLTQSRFTSDYSIFSSAQENGRIIGHVFYLVSQFGNTAQTKTIMLESIEHLSKSNDGDANSWSFEDVRIAMLDAAMGNQTLIDLVELAWGGVDDDGSAGTGSGGGSGGGCGLSTPINLSSTFIGVCSPFPYTQYFLLWDDVCPSATDFYQVWNFFVGGIGNTYVGSTTNNFTPYYINGGTANVHVRACNNGGSCSSLSAPVSAIDGC